MKYLKYIPILIALICSSCDREKFDSDNSIPEPEKLNIESLKEAPYPMGAALAINNLKNSEAYRNLVVKEMSSITAENAMKMSVISLGRKQYNFDDADYIVNFAQENNLRIHGHTLIWSRKEPPTWIKNFVGDKEEWKTIMKEYIQDVVGRYKGKVASWDVLNEIITDNGELQDCVWLQNIGPEFIELAFKYAHEADPDALLFYNDYGHEYSHVRRNSVYKIADSLVKKGIPIHGIGIQMHTNINRSINDLRYAIIAAATTKLKVHVSEIDISVNPDNKANIEFTENLVEAQKIRFRAVAKAMSDIPKDQQYGITTWGVRDPNYNSSNPDWPLLFNDKYERKPAYDGLLEGFHK